MTDLVQGPSKPIDVIVIGAGPAGLSAATRLKQLGVSRVVVLERELSAGGIPRHCGHPPFGLREFKRIYSGPQYAKKLTATALASGVELITGVTVVELKPNAHLLISDSENGLREIAARRVIYATGGREQPRSARLISGPRPQGVMNTGALQSMVYLGKRRPFKRPVIVGSELVSFSAIQTCRHAKIKPVAMIEQSSHITAFSASALYARLIGVSVHLSTQLLSIEGTKQVESVIVESAQGELHTIPCDGVILSGRFTPESSLANSSHLTLDDATGGPMINQYGQCSDNSYYAVGNVLRAIETAGWSWNEGRQVAEWVVEDLSNPLVSIPTNNTNITIVKSSPLIVYCVPQQLSIYGLNSGLRHLQLRFNERRKGELLVKSGNDVLWRKTLRVQPEKRVLIPIHGLKTKAQQRELQLQFNLDVI